MQALRWLQPAIVLVILAGAAPDLAAQDKLPAKMSGKWNGTTPGKGTPFGGDWSVVIEKQEGGAVEGKVNWVGRFCAIENEPFTGKFDGTTLTLAVEFRDRTPNAGCGKATLVLKKGSGNEFEGTIPGSRFNYQLTLKPS
jgi:hypothetical protein